MRSRAVSLPSCAASRSDPAAAELGLGVGAGQLVARGEPRGRSLPRRRGHSAGRLRPQRLLLFAHRARQLPKAARRA